MWCVMASPLIISANVRNISANVLETYLNKEAIAVNQDSLGLQVRTMLLLALLLPLMLLVLTSLLPAGRAHLRRRPQGGRQRGQRGPGCRRLVRVGLGDLVDQAAQAPALQRHAEAEPRRV